MKNNKTITDIISFVNTNLRRKWFLPNDENGYLRGATTPEGYTCLEISLNSLKDSIKEHQDNYSLIYYFCQFMVSTYPQLKNTQIKIYQESFENLISDLSFLETILELEYHREIFVVATEQIRQSKLQTVKIIKDAASLGLKEAKELVEKMYDDKEPLYFRCNSFKQASILKYKLKTLETTVTYSDTVFSSNNIIIEVERRYGN